MTLWLVEYFDGYECAEALAVFDDEELAARFTALWPGHEEGSRRIGFAKARELIINDTSAWDGPLERLDANDRLYGIDMRGGKPEEWECVLDPIWLEYHKTIAGPEDIPEDDGLILIYARSVEEAIAKASEWHAAKGAVCQTM